MCYARSPNRSARRAVEGKQWRRRRTAIGAVIEQTEGRAEISNLIAQQRCYNIRLAAAGFERLLNLIANGGRTDGLEQDFDGPSRTRFGCHRFGELRLSPPI